MRAKTLVLTVVSAGALAVTAGCGPVADDASGDGTQPGRGTGLAALTSDVKGSLTKIQDATSKAKSLSYSMTGTAGGETIKSHGSMSFGDALKAEMVVEDPKQGPVTVRMIGSVIYVQIPEKERAELGGKAWLKMDLTKAGAGTEDLTRQFQDLDPTKQVKTLIASGTVKAAGQEKVGGVQTVHYTGTSPLATYLGQLDPALRSAAEKTMTEKGVTEVKNDLWIDADYQLRRSRVVMGDTDLTSEYSDYGKAVTVEAPPAAEIADLNDLMGNLNLPDLGA